MALIPANPPNLDDLILRVEELSLQKFKKKPVILYFPRSQLRKALFEILNKDYSESLAKKESLYLNLMGFTEKRKNIKRMRLQLFMDNVNGFYHPLKKEIWLREEFRQLDVLNTMLIIQELRYAMQDQYFQASDQLPELSVFDDRRLAGQAAITGDAIFLMVKQSGFSSDVMSSCEQQSDALLSFTPIGNMVALMKAPQILRANLVMPYMEGLAFYEEILKKEKMKGVKQVLKRIPQSTAQILHPDKYLSGELPEKVHINYQPPDFKIFHSGVIGEYNLNILLNFNGSDQSYASGWAGDWFEIYLNGSAYCLVWKACFEKTKAGSHFYYDFKRFLEQMYKLNFKEDQLSGKTFLAAESISGYFFLGNYQGTIFYMRTNNRNLINMFISGGKYD
jgi:hypothetical protein